MSVFSLILVLLVAVLLSTIVAQVSSRISVSLVQIGIGILLALFINAPVRVALDPEIFLVLFIAPLLFVEAKNLNRLGFWQNKGMIVSLALGLVVATTAAVGFGMSAIMPALPLAAALALGAALGPTDAVTVSSMSKVAHLSTKQKSILAGEYLINDASGLVAFQFAIGLALTGEVALAEAGVSFIHEFVGGILLGCVLGWVCNIVVGFARNRGLENRRFHVLFELMLPFIAYMFADSIHVSGILSVVACGIVFSVSYGNPGISSSKTNIVSSSVWDVLSFALNGVVFVLLGMMLPDSMFEHLDNVATINWPLIGSAFILTAIVIACRFVWVLIVDRVFFDAEEINSNLVRHAAIITFSGAKGAITLSIAMTIPYSFAMRDDIIFMASVAIVLTLLLANFVVPMLAPANNENNERKTNEYKIYTKILRQVIERLTEDVDDAEYVERIGYRTVIAEYGTRIDKIKKERGLDNESMVELRYDAMLWQESCAKMLAARNKFSDDVVDEFVEKNARRRRRIKKHSNLTWVITQYRRIIRMGVLSFLMSFGVKTTAKTEDSENCKALQIECYKYVIEQLTSLAASRQEQYKSEDIATLLVEYQRSLGEAKLRAPSVTQYIESTDLANKIRMKALRYEQEYVNEAYSDGLIDRKSANNLRRQIAAMQLDAFNEL